jgi:K+-sensing histidine kinase KdpD
MTAGVKDRTSSVMNEPVDLKPRTHWIEQLPVARDRPLLGTVVMLGIVAGALALRMVTDPLLPPGFPYVTFFPAVIVTSFLFGVRLGVVSAALCGLIAWYFFIPRRGGRYHRPYPLVTTADARSTVQIHRHSRRCGFPHI